MFKNEAVSASVLELVSLRSLRNGWSCLCYCLPSRPSVWELSHCGVRLQRKTVGSPDIHLSGSLGSVPWMGWKGLINDRLVQYEKEQSLDLFLAFFFLGACGEGG